MKLYFRYIIVLIVMFISSVSIAKNKEDEKKTDGKIKVAIMEFAAKGDISKKHSDFFSEIISNKIKEAHIFEVIERKQVNEIIKTAQKETALQMSGIVGESDIVELGKIISVKQLVIGTVGELYGKIIITIRLVNAETGKNIFANTLFTTKKDFSDDISSLVAEISENAQIYNEIITIEKIKESYEDDNYRKAWNQMNRYLESGSLTEELKILRKKIVEELAEKYYDDADDALDDGHYREARMKINYAIAIQNRDKYLKFRDEILQEENNYILFMKNKRKQDRQRINNMDVDYRSTSQKVKDYYNSLPYNGLLLGVASGVSFTEYNKIEDKQAWWGGEVIGINTFSRGVQDITGLMNVGYAGLNVHYDDFDSVSSQFVFQAYISPLAGFEVKLGNFFWNVGLDAGGIIRVSKGYDSGKLWGVTGGALSTMQLKFGENIGFFAGFKFDYEYYKSDSEYSGFQGRIISGIVF